MPSNKSKRSPSKLKTFSTMCAPKSKLCTNSIIPTSPNYTTTLKMTFPYTLCLNSLKTANFSMLCVRVPKRNSMKAELLTIFGNSRKLCSISTKKTSFIVILNLKISSLPKMINLNWQILDGLTSLRERINVKHTVELSTISHLKWYQRTTFMITELIFGAWVYSSSNYALEPVLSHRLYSQKLTLVRQTLRKTYQLSIILYLKNYLNNVKILYRKFSFLSLKIGFLSKTFSNILGFKKLLPRKNLNLLSRKTGKLNWRTSLAIFKIQKMKKSRNMKFFRMKKFTVILELKVS